MSENQYGVVIGIVKDLDDPTGQSRIRLQYPAISDTELSGWAPIARPMAGKRRGHFFMPELEDEALVVFNEGKFDHPYVIGFLHNGVDLPPDDGIDKQVRRIRTVCGHILEFDDRSGKERILLKTQGGHLLEMKDAEGSIEIKTSGGQQIVLKDTPGQIKLTTASGTSVTLDDVPGTITAQTPTGVSITVSDAGGVSVTSATGPVSVTALSATLTATTACTISAPTVSVSAGLVSFTSGFASFSGVVQCSALITNSVVSASYTPGAGNIW
jgi:uncharacterized protein involved in type VI secretion and phage assembly